ncbi:MAG: serine/threonine-protein phosphatase, partial [Lachnospiraceae bacterium]|nr:serine/threonine-protein phosphatase [Lachnospiraceae bacterium]
EKNKRILIISYSVFFLLVLAFEVVFVLMRGMARLERVYLLNVGIDIMGLFIGYVIFVCCIMDEQKALSNTKNLLRIVITVSLSLVFDTVAWVVDGLTEYRLVNILVNTLYYMCAPFEAVLFVYYVRGYLKFYKKIEKQIDIFLNVGLAVSIVMRIINIFNGMYFRVDENGVYSRTSLYPLSMVYIVITLIGIFIIIIRERKQFSVFQFVTLLLYIIVPGASLIITYLFYGLSISGGIMMLVVLLMYSTLNVAEGRKIAVVNQDLEVASAIQQNVLPNTFPFMPERKEFDLFASMTPAKEVGGDFYDFFMVDDNRLAMVIADVSGKGMPAALFMMVSKTLIKSQTLAMPDKDPGEILEVVNGLLCEGNKLQMFVTAWLGIIDLKTGKITYANAGHEYPAIKRKVGKFRLFRDIHSVPLGSFEDMIYPGGIIMLRPGDIIYVYTDGVTEATNSDLELFGTNRMLDALNKASDNPVEVLDANIRREIQRFMVDAPQFDDITMLALKYNGVE